MSLFYTLAYHVGFTPWEKAAAHPAAARHILSLFDRVEQDRQPPYGRALDIGCGTGYWSVTMAQRGWDVTGVDLVPKAVGTARKRAENAGVDVRFLEGDVTALHDLGIQPGVRLVWDFGMLHGLASEQVQAAAREVTALASDDATMLMLAWAPGKRGPIPRGLSTAEVEQAFSAWRVTAEEPFDVTGLPKPLRKVNPRVLRLQRA